MWVVESPVPIDAWVVLNESAIPDTPPLALALTLDREPEPTVWKLPQSNVPLVLNVASGLVAVQVTFTVKEAGSPELILCGQGCVVGSIDALTDALCRPLAIVNADAGMMKQPWMKFGGKPN